MHAIVPRCDILLLAEDGQPAGRFIGGLDEKRPGAAGRVVHGVILLGVRSNSDHLGHDAGDFRRSVELSLALARLGREVPHEVLVGVAQEVVAMGPVGAEVEPLKDPDQLRETILHLLALAKLALVVEISLVDHILEEVIVGVGEFRRMIYVDSIADLLGPLERDHVGKTCPPAAPRYRHSGHRCQRTCPRRTS